VIDFGFGMSGREVLPDWAILKSAKKNESEKRKALSIVGIENEFASKVEINNIVNYADFLKSTIFSGNT